MTTVEVLRAARALIDTPERWAKNGDAFDDDLCEVEVDDARAECWCAGGAIDRVAGHVDLTAYHAFAAAANVQYPYEFNDRLETTHADVLAAFDRAIEAEKAKAHV